MGRNQEMDRLALCRRFTEYGLLVVALGVTLVFASGCASRRQEQVDTAASTIVPIRTTVVSSSLLENEDEALRPPATFTPKPTVTVPPTLIAAPLAPTPILRASQFGISRNRLTGELMDDPALLQRRPIAVKISNAPARWTRPQSGLSQADLVYEHLTEGSITRFTAIFYGQTPPRVGPIRSARLIDLELPAMYDAALAFSGSSIGVSRKLFSSDFSERILRTNTSGYYRTGEDKPYEHTLYATPDQLWETLESREQNREPQFGSTMAFSEAVPPGGGSAPLLTVRYYKFSTIEWRYDVETGRYLRWVDGEEHLDANTGKQIGAGNVVVLVAPHRLDETICEHQSGNRCLAYSMEIQLWGEGPAIVLRDGRAFEVNWRRSQRHDLLTLQDEGGRPFPLQIGNTWFQVVPADYPDAFELG